MGNKVKDFINKLEDLQKKWARQSTCVDAAADGSHSFTAAAALDRILHDRVMRPRETRSRRGANFIGNSIRSVLIRIYAALLCL